MDIKEKITKITGIENFLYKSGRTKEVINAKMLYAKYNRDIEGRTFQSIANDFGLKQHGTVINLVNRFNDYSKYDYKLRNQFNLLIENPNEAKRNPLENKVYAIVDELMELKDESDLDYVLEKMRINIKVRNNLNNNNNEKKEN